MRRPLLALIVVAAGLTGCGGGDDDDGSGRKAVTVGHNQPIAFGADEYSFEPANVIVNSGTSGTSVVRFVVRNNGSLGHDLHVRDSGGKDLGGTPIFGPDKTASGQVTVRPGEYELFCSVGDHEQLGMKGKLTVTSEKTKRPPDPDAGAEGEKERGEP